MKITKQLCIPLDGDKRPSDATIKQCVDAVQKSAVIEACLKISPKNINEPPQPEGFEARFIDGVRIDPYLTVLGGSSPVINPEWVKRTTRFVVSLKPNTNPDVANYRVDPEIVNFMGNPSVHIEVTPHVDVSKYSYGFYKMP